MAKTSWQQQLSRRERQVMDVLFTRGLATAAEIRESLPEPPSYSAVRALLRVMEEKQLLSHLADGPRYLYKPAIPPRRARKSALKQMLDTLFNGSREELVTALLDPQEAKLTGEELDRLACLIEQARRAGR